MRQYEIRWANLPAPIGRRPVLLLTRTSAYAYLNKVIVAEVTSTIRDIPEEVTPGKKDGVSRPSVVNLDNVHVVAKVLQLGRATYAAAAFRSSAGAPKCDFAEPSSAIASARSGPTESAR